MVERRHVLPLLLFVALAGLFLAGHAAMRSQPLLIDEHAHTRHILRLLRFELDPVLAMPPGYHVFIASIARVLGVTEIASLRLSSGAIGLLTLVVFYLSLAGRPPRTAALRTLRLALMPILFPLFFLIYTDVLSLGLVLLALVATQRRDYRFAGAILCVSLLVRQNNVIWMLLMFILMVEQSHGFDPRRIDGRKLLYDAWVFAVGFIAIGVFVVSNRGFSVGGATWHPLGIHLGNFYFLLFCAFVLFLPQHLAKSGEIRALVARRWTIVLPLLGAGFGLYMGTFENAHPLNQEKFDWSIRNRILLFVTASPVAKAAFFLPIAWTTLSLCVTRLGSRAQYALYPLTFLCITPSALIEQRYYLIPFALWMSFEEERPAWVERASIAVYLILTALVFEGMLSRRFFL